MTYVEPSVPDDAVAVGRSINPTHTAQGVTGDVGATVSVYNSAGTILVPIFSDPYGASPLANPGTTVANPEQLGANGAVTVAADTTGQFQFYVPFGQGAPYNLQITVTSSAGGTATMTVTVPALS